MGIQGSPGETGQVAVAHQAAYQVAYQVAYQAAYQAASQGEIGNLGVVVAEREDVHLRRCVAEAVEAMHHLQLVRQGERDLFQLMRVVGLLEGKEEYLGPG